MKHGKLFDFASYLTTISHTNNPTPFTFQSKSDISTWIRQRVTPEDCAAPEPISTFNESVLETLYTPDQSIPESIFPLDKTASEPMQVESTPKPISNKSAPEPIRVKSTAEPISSINNSVSNPISTPGKSQPISGTTDSTPTITAAPEPIQVESAPETT
ncbi:hypothetical protein BT96DRAFT_1004709 [Gymnopus androsaceus JB14]|uniref:Uncharacterized protein n=1 Tax=Gymnopus androsaceus JB14 TaxID=1447944 RepID=A0A6A4GQ12_9AGAR|nr:hypothetical protein BT96DRAFT_1004709 [Gymnopus androsaceus JB14]